MARRKRREGDYLDALRDWQEHQYVRGYYAGRIPPLWLHMIRQTWRPSWLVVVFLVPALLSLVGGVFVVSANPDVPTWPALVFTLVVSLSSLAAGVALWKRSSAKNRADQDRERQRKRRRA